MLIELILIWMWQNIDGDVLPVDIYLLKSVTLLSRQQNYLPKLMLHSTSIILRVLILLTCGMSERQHSKMVSDMEYFSTYWKGHRLCIAKITHTLLLSLSTIPCLSNVKRHSVMARVRRARRRGRLSIISCGDVFVFLDSLLTTESTYN